MWKRRMEFWTGRAASYIHSYIFYLLKINDEYKKNQGSNILVKKKGFCDQNETKCKKKIFSKNLIWKIRKFAMKFKMLDKLIRFSVPFSL